MRGGSGRLAVWDTGPPAPVVLGGKLESAVFPDAALKSFKAAGVELQENVAVTGTAADIAAEGSYFLQESFVQCLYGGDNAGFQLTLLFPGHFHIVQI